MNILVTGASRGIGKTIAKSLQSYGNVYVTARNEEKLKEFGNEMYFVCDLSKEEDLLKLKDFIHSLNSVQKVEILPYHDLGRFKWEELGLKYELDGVSPATPEDVSRAKKILSL